MTARPFAGLRVVLVAAFNRRYHRSGLSLATALESLGCEVTRLEERERGWNAILRRPVAQRLGARLRRAPVDVVLVFKGPNLAPEQVRTLRGRFGARWANWFPDDPHRIELSLRIGPAYDCFFTHDSSTLERHRAAGARPYYLAFGCDPDYLRPLPAGPRWAAPIAFVASRDLVREAVIQELADLPHLPHLPHLPVATWGPGWPRGPVYGDDFVRVLSNALVGLNVHQQFGDRGDPARYGTGANMRVFELAAVGTPQLSDAKTDITRHFAPDREIVLYRSVAELKERARALLADERLRRGLATAARERALREHTWRHRLEELLTVTLR
jgi:spore maturation protein CgeB